MNLMEVKHLLDKLDEQKLERAYLQAIKPHGWRPKGFKFRTCFGLAEILNIIDKKDENDREYTSIVFTIEKEKIIKWFNKASSLALHQTSQTTPSSEENAER